MELLFPKLKKTVGSTCLGSCDGGACFGHKFKKSFTHLSKEANWTVEYINGALGSDPTWKYKFEIQKM